MARLSRSRSGTRTLRRRYGAVSRWARTAQSGWPRRAATPRTRSRSPADSRQRSGPRIRISSSRASSRATRCRPRPARCWPSCSACHGSRSSRRSTMTTEHLQGRLSDATGELVSAAVGIGARVTVAVIAADPGPLVDAADLQGVDEIVAVRAGAAEFEVDPYTEALAALASERRPDVVLLGFTVNSMSYGPAVAARLGLGFASDVFAISHGGDGLVATRAFYGSKVHGDLEFGNVPGVVLLLRRTVWPAAEPGGGATRSETEITLPASRARHVEFVEAPAADVDITAADFLLSIRRGIGDPAPLERFAA